MPVVDLNQQPQEEWRPGVQTRMMRARRPTARRSSACSSNGASRGTARRPTCMRSRRCCTCSRARPTSGSTIRTPRLSAGQLAIVPAGRKHGFSNIGTGTLHIQSTLAAPVFEAAYDDKRETPRRWLPG